MTELLDTNIILRYLVGDDKDQYQKAEKIFKEAESGKRKLEVKVVVIAESCFVLESFYKKKKDVIASAMEVFLSQKWLKVDDKKAMQVMWKWYRGGLHFVDSYLLALSFVNKSKIVTFDKALEKRKTGENIQ